MNLTQISFIEKLSEENLFIILQEKEEISKYYLWGKVIEKDEKNQEIRIMDSNKELLTLEKYNDEIKLGQYFIFSNYSKKGNIISIKEDKKDSFIYYSSQDLYFSDKIRLNLYSVIQFHFIDYNMNDDNIYKKIVVERKAYTIECSKKDVVFQHKAIDINNKIIIIEIELIKHEFDKTRFLVEVLQGFVNKFNVFINYEGQPSYYFEYIHRKT